MLYLVKISLLSSNSLNCEILGKLFTSIKIHLFIRFQVIVVFKRPFYSCRLSDLASEWRARLEMTLF